MLRLPPYTYHRPATIEAAIALLAEHRDEGALPIAGGTDLVPNMKHKLFTPGHVVALRGIDALHGITLADGEIVIGAAETLQAVSEHPLVREHLPSLAEAAGRVAGPQLRAMGTIGGNLCLDTRCTYYNQSYFWRHALGFCLKKDGDTCHVTKVGKKCVAAHSADTPPVLLTLDAVADVVGPDGARTIPLSDYFVADGIWNEQRQPGELVTRIRVPVPSAGRRAAYQKLRQRNAIDFPLLSVAAAAGFDDGDVVSDLRVVVSALGSRPRTITGLDKVASGERLTAEVIDAVAERAFQMCHPLTNIIVDPDWRRAMVPVQVRRCLQRLATGG